MNKQSKTVFLAALAFAAHSGSASAYYSASATLDAAGNRAGAADLAVVRCFDNGNGAPHHLAAAVQDLSPPASGLLLSLQILKAPSIATVTDRASADGNFSPIAILAGGAGTYYLSLSKTAAGARNFLVGWECQTASNTGTGTDISVLQIQ